MIKAFLLQVQFLTRIPLPFNPDFDERAMAKGMVFAPVVGLIIGLFAGGIYYLVFYFSGKAVPALMLALIGEIIITGGLHLDGLADTFDGIFSNRSKEKILEIMKDSRIGTNGALALFLLIVLKLGLLFSINEGHVLYCLFLMPVFSRMNIVWSAGISSYAGATPGMGSPVVEFTGPKEIVISTVIAAAAGILFIRILALPLLAASVLFVLLFTVYVKKKINGITGDIIGAVIELTEVVVLFTMFVLEVVLKYI